MPPMLDYFEMTVSNELSKLAPRTMISYCGNSDFGPEILTGVTTLRARNRLGILGRSSHRFVAVEANPGCVSDHRLQFLFATLSATGAIASALTVHSHRKLKLASIANC